MLEKRLALEDQIFRWMIDLLPKSVDEFPIFFENEELEYLKGSPILEYIQETRASIQLVYEKIC
jgi:protein-histidine N-methyltransferase